MVWVVLTCDKMSPRWFLQYVSNLLKVEEEVAKKKCQAVRINYVKISALHDKWNAFQYIWDTANNYT